MIIFNRMKHAVHVTVSEERNTKHRTLAEKPTGNVGVDIITRVILNVF
jgi:hypothetical protein